MKKVFILGNPRSGTSLFRLMLNSHSKIVAPPECGFLQWWHSKYCNWSIENNTNEGIESFIEDLKKSKKIETWGIDFSKLFDFIKNQNPENYSRLGEAVYLFYSTIQGKECSVIVDKNNYYINYLNELIEIWPDAYFIHLVRDGRDVACSYKDIQNLSSNSIYKPKLTNSIEEIANEWKQNNDNIQKFLDSNCKGKSFCLRYEDIVLNTKVELGNICAFLGLNFEEQMLEYYFQELHDEPKETMDWKMKTLSPPDKTNVGRYKNSLIQEEIDLFNKISGDCLLRFNYSLL